MIIEAHTVFILLVLAGLMLLSSLLGISPMDDWHTGLTVACCGGASGLIGLWIYRDFRR